MFMKFYFYMLDVLSQLAILVFMQVQFYISQLAILSFMVV